MSATVNAATPAAILERELREISANAIRDNMRSHLEPMETPLAFLEGMAALVSALASSPCMIDAAALLPVSSELRRIHTELDAAFLAAWREAGGKA